MKIITWNCNGAFRNKYQSLLPFGADVWVIQECEDPAASTHKGYRQWAANYLWCGDNKHRGIAIFAASHIHLRKLNWPSVFEGATVKHFLPCRINKKFSLLAVWTHQNNSPAFAYIGQLWMYLQLHKSKLRHGMIAGDFNSNVKWDRTSRWWNHSDVTRELKELGIESFYHRSTGEEPGKESQPTFYLHRKKEKPYHLDYCFGSADFFKLNQLLIGEFEAWKVWSDHVPVMVDVDLM